MRSGSKTETKVNVTLLTLILETKMATSDKMKASETEASRNDLFSCTICYTPFDDSDYQPKLLPCHHSFCRQCLCRLLEQNKKLKCPVCAKKVSLGEKGIDGLSTNFYLSKFAEFLKIDDQEKTFPPICNEVCQSHANTPKLYWCNTCCEQICVNCKCIDHSVENGHDVDYLSKTITNLQYSITMNFENVKDEIAKMIELKMAVDDGDHPSLSKMSSVLQNVLETLSKNCKNAVKASMDAESFLDKISQLCSSERFKNNPNALLAIKDRLDDVLLYTFNIGEFSKQQSQDNEKLKKSNIVLSVVKPEVNLDSDKCYCIRCGKICTTCHLEKMGKEHNHKVKYVESCCENCGNILMGFV